MQISVVLSLTPITVDALTRIYTLTRARAPPLPPLISHIKDIENFDLLLDTVPEIDRFEILHRVGHLNVMNPLKPDGHYRLELDIYEQREVAKMLIELAAAEDGENWIGERYKRSFEKPFVPDWQVRRREGWRPRLFLFVCMFEL